MNSRTSKFISHSADESVAFSQSIAENLLPGMVVAFYGDLGSGKTTMIRGICHYLNVTEPVTSPSFAIVQEYQGNFDIFHFDFYRLNTLDEVLDIGFEMYLEYTGICLIEWPEIAERVLPTEHIKIEIETIYSSDELEPSNRIITVISPFEVLKPKESFS